MVLGSIPSVPTMSVLKLLPFEGVFLGIEPYGLTRDVIRDISPPSVPTISVPEISYLRRFFCDKRELHGKSRTCNF